MAMAIRRSNSDREGQCYTTTMDLSSTTIGGDNTRRSDSSIRFHNELHHRHPSALEQDGSRTTTRDGHLCKASSFSSDYDNMNERRKGKGRQRTTTTTATTTCGQLEQQEEEATMIRKNDCSSSSTSTELLLAQIERLQEENTNLRNLVSSLQLKEEEEHQNENINYFPMDGLKETALGLIRQVTGGGRQTSHSHNKGGYHPLGNDSTSFDSVASISRQKEKGTIELQCSPMNSEEEQSISSVAQQEGHNLLVECGSGLSRKEYSISRDSIDDNASLYTAKEGITVCSSRETTETCALTSNDRYRKDETPQIKRTNGTHTGAKKDSSNSQDSLKEPSSMTVDSMDDEPGAGEPYRVDEPFWTVLLDRAKWLVGLMVLQSCSSFILEKNEVLLQKHPVIVQFLTMLVGAGGNAGNQACVRVIRGLAVGTLNHRTLRHYLSAEARMGVLLSIILSFAGLIRAAVFMVPVKEMITITLTLFCIMAISLLMGAILPLGMRFVNIDPAHSSTTIQVVMDITGVLVTVTISSLILGSSTLK